VPEKVFVVRITTPQAATELEGLGLERRGRRRRTAGRPGDDVLLGGPGTDIIDGGDGDDVEIQRAGVDNVTSARVAD
jgi:hypothetical protein